mgnify:CR=1 FL=1
MSYFSQFPKVDYDFNRTGSINKMVDIFRSIRPLKHFLDSFTGYKFYEVHNGERPDIVSHKIYGSSGFYWTFFIVNDFLHEGYKSWPMSQEDLYAYIQKEYSGKVIEVNPTMIGNTQVDSIAGKFKLGETITGQTTGATGRLVKKNTDMHQLILKDVTGVFQGNMHEPNGVQEAVKGGTSTDLVNTFRVYNYADAPYYYYSEFDGEKKPVTNALHITGGVPTSDLKFKTYREEEQEKNDVRSRIRYIDDNRIEEFINDFERLINV